MAKGTHNQLSFELDQPDIVLRGMADDSQGTVFSGRLVANLCEPIRVKGLKMVLEGHEHLQWEYHNDGAISTFFRETTPLTHTWSFFSTADGKRVETWEAGRHEFPFSLVFPGSLPESIRIPYANVSYQLKATLRRTGIMSNITARREVPVKRDLTMEGAFGTGAIDVENRWRGMMDFSITSDADTFTPGDQLRARFAFQPLVKHMRLTKIGVMLKEYVRCHTPTGHAEKTVSRVAAFTEAVPRPPAAASTDECIALNAPAASSSVAAAEASSPKGARHAAGSLGVDLTGAFEERIKLTIPAEQRRLQYDHISSYVEITHKLKFSIHFQDPEKKPHTLWISVPVSVVPTIVDSTHGAGPELPTYQNAALDQRVVVAAIEQRPPTYDAVMTETLERASSLEPSIPSPGSIAMTISSPSTTPSSTASMHSRDEMDISTMGPSLATIPAAPEQCHVRDAASDQAQTHARVSRTHFSVDSSRPLLHPSVIRNFLRRPIVFPASAEATPLGTPLVSPSVTPMTSPLLKTADDAVPAIPSPCTAPGASAASASRPLD
ncbi:hypothetical protein GGF46_000801 [Coemansia sp. RSA 552]|nr:hypothetical protein GGF46_000801 [Coemansia sp. RSA 552]